jgi:hypothetical protein
LGSQQLQNRNAVRSKGTRSQIILQIKGSDKLRLFNNRETKDRRSALALGAR